MSSKPPPAPPDDGAAALSAVLSEVREVDAEVASAEARRVRALARAGHLALDASAGLRASARAAELALREVASEIAAAECVSDRAVQGQIGRAMTLADDFPVTLDAWEAGALTRAHVRVIVDAGLPLPQERRAEFDVLAVATADGLSPGRLKARLAALAESLQSTTLTERHRRGRETRCVRVVTGEDGMSDLIATLPTVLAVGIYDRLVQQSAAIIDMRRDTPREGLRSPAGTAIAADAPGTAIAVDAPGAEGRTVGSGEPVEGTAAGHGSTATSAPAPDTRTADQVRADILADLLLTAAPDADPTRADDGPGVLGAIRARVQVVVPALTMLRPGDENSDPAALVGHGPIDADTARGLAEATPIPWDRVITHPVSGAVLRTDTYHRTAAIDRHLRARDRHCRWPGCTTPAVRCEVDHTHDHALGGPTDTRNLAHLCQRHHTQKQFTRWKARQVPGGVLEWTSPTGRVYTDEPQPYAPAVRFLPDELAPPPPPRPPSDRDNDREPAPF
ncbi:HNH endonuclease signature motif containing protein [Microbacterium sp. RURRCA19A]|uniref:HNH endonuclease signature motif containing protein n=1 Tax=Microbacterium sp. RURRCA19A TaxID=1907391 RepID=UPI0009547F17|nr:HNH endonuclease signature motif containing protein [Microbacterium sp. RURRCA19A]SIR96334.1 protein of unknown function [Microbacterium sp. RURRCA19A]